jgi:hypothetical protein
MVTLKQISVDTANGLSLQVAAKRIGIKTLGLKYKTAVFNERITMDEVDLLRGRLKALRVKTIPEFIQKRHAGVAYPNFPIVYATE